MSRVGRKLSEPPAVREKRKWMIRRQRERKVREQEMKREGRK